MVIINELGISNPCDEPYEDCLDDSSLDNGFGDDDDLTCSSCHKEFEHPKVINCLHSFCYSCVEKLALNDVGDNKLNHAIICPKCQERTILSSPAGIDSLVADFVAANRVEEKHLAENSSQTCTSCKSQQKAVARCNSCPSFLCSNCEQAHLTMMCFESHHVISLADLKRGGLPNGDGDLASSGGHDLVDADRKVVFHKPVYCVSHPNGLLKYYCSTCQNVLCSDCKEQGHPSMHAIDTIEGMEKKQVCELEKLVEQAKEEAEETEKFNEKVNDVFGQLEDARHKAKSAIDESYLVALRILQKHKDEMMKRLDEIHKSKEMEIMELSHKIEEISNRLESGQEFAERILKHGNGVEILATKSAIFKQIQPLLTRLPNERKIGVNLKDMTFISGGEGLAQSIVNNFGTFHCDQFLMGAPPLSSSVGPAADGSAARGSTPTGDTSSSDISFSIPSTSSLTKNNASGSSGGGDGGDMLHSQQPDRFQPYLLPTAGQQAGGFGASLNLQPLDINVDGDTAATTSQLALNLARLSQQQKLEINAVASASSASLASSTLTSTSSSTAATAMSTSSQSLIAPGDLGTAAASLAVALGASNPAAATSGGGGIDTSTNLAVVQQLLQQYMNNTATAPTTNTVGSNSALTNGWSSGNQQQLPTQQLTPGGASGPPGGGTGFTPGKPVMGIGAGLSGGSSSIGGGPKVGGGTGSTSPNSSIDSGLLSTLQNLLVDNNVLFPNPPGTSPLPTNGPIGGTGGSLLPNMPPPPSSSMVQPPQQQHMMQQQPPPPMSTSGGGGVGLMGSPPQIDGGFPTPTVFGQQQPPTSHATSGFGGGAGGLHGSQGMSGGYDSSTGAVGGGMGGQQHLHQQPQQQSYGGGMGGTMHNYGMPPQHQQQSHLSMQQQQSSSSATGSTGPYGGSGYGPTSNYQSIPGSGVNPSPIPPPVSSNNNQMSQMHNIGHFGSGPPTSGGGGSGGGTPSGSGGGSTGSYQPNPHPPFPTRTGGKTSAMQIRAKFGQLGPGRGQFNSPHGFCLGVEEEIIIADTNNHRIQVFDKNSDFKFVFGVPGREEGQLWYPRKVAVMRTTGKFVVCDRGNERSRMQIFNRTGSFIKKIAIRYIDIVAGLVITAQGNIVAVDSVSPTVFVIAESGDLIKWFDCSEYMREPSDIAVSQNEFFICDFKGHCVVVFNEAGQFVRRIGSENLTNFPNGIDISDAGDVLVGDSHGNRFHVTVFQRSGDLIGEFECPYVKVSRCCGLKITAQGYIVTLAKNNHHVLILNTLYIA